MTQVAEMDAVQAAELEATPWDRQEFTAYQWAYAGARQRVDIYGHSLAKTSEYKPWHCTQQDKLVLHPCVELMLETHRPKNTAQLCLEWAHVADSDDTRIAYTRNDADGASDRQLVTSIGKYLARHWPHVPDHVRRDIQAFFVPDERVIVTTTPEMVRAVEDGPRSCMASAHGSISFNHGHAVTMREWFKNSMLPQPDWKLHPYSSYSPALGWSMARRTVRLPDGTKRIDGRALIYTGAEVEKPVFVRTYKRNMKNPVDGWSETDFALHAWLERNGYVKVDSWPEGVRLFTPPAREGGTDRRMPYMDGTRRLLVPVEGETDISRLVYGACDQVGGYWAENTSGVAQRMVPRISRNRNVNNHDSLEDFAIDNEYDVDDCLVCNDCGRYHHQDDSTSVGRDGGHNVCENCNDVYIYVRGSTYRGTGYTSYYIHQDDAYPVEGHDYSIDSNNPPEDVVVDQDGDFRERDDCVYVESCGEYYSNEDERVVYDTNGDYQLRDDCVRTEDTDEWVRTEDAYESGDVCGVYFESEDARDEYDAPDDEEEEETETPMALAIPQAA